MMHRQAGENTGQDSIPVKKNGKIQPRIYDPEFQERLHDLEYRMAILESHELHSRLSAVEYNQQQNAEIVDWRLRKLEKIQYNEHEKEIKPVRYTKWKSGKKKTRRK